MISFELYYLVFVHYSEENQWGRKVVGEGSREERTKVEQMGNTFKSADN